MIFPAIACLTVIRAACAVPGPPTPRKEVAVTSDACQPVSVSRAIEAPADRLFGLLSDPARHPLIDGSGMLRECSGGAISRAGDVFTMKMHNAEMGDYEMANHVVVFEPGRRVGWEPVLTDASRPEDQDGIGDRSKPHRWSFELTPLSATSTLVTETYDCTRAPAWLRKVVRGGTRWIPDMTATLEKLDALSRG